MKHYLNVRTTLSAVLTLGLASCADKPAPSSATKAAPWKIDEPILRRQGHQDYRLTETESQVGELKITDSLIFAKGDNVGEGERFSGIKLSVKTSCQFQETRLETYETELPLKSSFYIYEFLPLSALLEPNNPLDRGLSCHFQFLAKNSKGSTHRFQLSLAPIDRISQQGNGIEFTVNRVPMKLNEGQWLELNLDNLSGYRVQGLSQENKKAKLICQRFSAEVPVIAGVAELQNVNRPNHEVHGDAQRKSQFCRLVGLSDNNQVKNVSDILILRSPVPRLTSLRLDTPQSTLAVGGQIHHDIGRFLLKNEENFPITVGFPHGKRQKILISLVALTDTSRVSYLSHHKVPIQIEVQGAKTTTVNFTSYVRIPAFGTFEIVAAHNLRPGSFKCSNGHLIQGFYQTLANPNGLIAQVFESSFDLGKVSESAPSQIDQAGILVLDANTTPLWRFEDGNCGVGRPNDCSVGKIISGPNISGLPDWSKRCRLR